MEVRAVIYNRRELAILCYVGGLFTGLIVGFAACTPTPDPPATTSPAVR
jgi:hypothetical protein